MHSAESHKTPSLLTVLCGCSPVRCLPGLSRRWARLTLHQVARGVSCLLGLHLAPLQSSAHFRPVPPVGLPASALQPARVLVRAPRETATLTLEYVFYHFLGPVTEHRVTVHRLGPLRALFPDVKITVFSLHYWKNLRLNDRRQAAKKRLRIKARELKAKREISD